MEAVLRKADDTEQLLVCEVDLSGGEKAEKESSVSFHTETGMVQDLKNGTKKTAHPKKWVSRFFCQTGRGIKKEYR